LRKEFVGMFCPERGRKKSRKNRKDEEIGGEKKKNYA